MNVIGTLYAGDATSVDNIESGDCMRVELLDTAVALLMGNDYMKLLKKKTNKIKIKMSKLQYSQLKFNELSLLFTNYFDYDNITFYNDNIDYDRDGYIRARDNEGFTRKATVSYGNKCVEIYSSII